MSVFKVTDPIEPGDVFERGGIYYVYNGYDFNQYNFYIDTGRNLRAYERDKMVGFKKVGHVQPGRGIKKRFAEFVKDLKAGVQHGGQ